MQSTLNDPLRQLSLKHDFQVYETPAKLYELTPIFLRELFDQVIHYGFPDAPLSLKKILFLIVNNKPIIATASLDHDFLMLRVGFSHMESFYLITSNGLIFWENCLRVSDIMKASANLDQIMEERGFYDRASNSRVDLIEAKSFKVNEVFAKPFLTYVLPLQRDYEISELFDQPKQVVTLHLYGRDIACKRDEANMIRKTYTPLTQKDVQNMVKCHIQNIQAQMNPKRYS